MRSTLGPRTSPALIDRTWNLLHKALEEEKTARQQKEKSKVSVSSTEKHPQNEAAINGSNGAASKRKGEEEEPTAKKSKKKRLNNGENESPVENRVGQTNDSGLFASEDDTAHNTKVKWGSIGKAILRQQEDKELSLKKFQKKIVAEYMSRIGPAEANTPPEVLWAKALKKLSKNPKFKILKERIKLVC